MTIEANSAKVGRFGRRSGTSRSTALPIGETDANIFNCPACARPLGTGVARCTGCWTRLIAEVQAGRAVGFMAIGLFAGVVAGGIMAAMVLTSRPVETVVVQSLPIVTPTAAPLASAALPVVNPGIPTTALSALRQSAVLNQRIVVDAERLTEALAASSPSGNVIAPILRSLAWTATFGGGMASAVGDWDEGASVSTGLVALYASIGSVADEALSSSIRNPEAYIAAARQMLVTIGGVVDLDAASRVLAAKAGLDMPPVVLPGG